MKLSLFGITLALISGNGLVNAQCGNTDTGACDWEPFNPVTCGPNKDCSYENFCLAQENGFDVQNDCCQAPQPSGCTQEFAPVSCGSQSCEYPNRCVASLAGYDPTSQCQDLPPACPESTADCSGDPSNPFNCGPAKDCRYETICDLESAGYNLDQDCCQAVRDTVACPAILEPVYCGPPHKQCPYGNTCEAEASGYKENQCCPAPRGNTACPLIEAPVECGDPNMPCSYPSICVAESAGWATEDCCPVAQGACTTENKPVVCGKCVYGNQGCAELAGFTSMQCCDQPLDTGSCTLEYAPVACSTANCIYSNGCVAELAGFDSNSCVIVPQGSSAEADSDAADGADGLTPVTMDGNMTASADDMDGDKDDTHEHGDGHDGHSHDDGEVHGDDMDGDSDGTDMDSADGSGTGPQTLESSAESTMAKAVGSLVAFAGLLFA